MDHPDLVYERIWNLREEGSAKSAFELCWSAANAYGRDCRFWLALGVIAGEQNKYCHATMALERAATLRPLSPCVQCRLGWAYLQSGETESARQIFKSLCAKGEVQTQLLPIMSAGLGRLGENHLALDLCREAVRRDPDADEAYRGLAYYMSRCGYPAEVILATMHKAAQLAPSAKIIA
ncbi:MAG: tetratricopeptide repeat protein [Pirellulales bacterium]